MTPIRLQDLAPRSARLCLEVERFLQEDLHLDLVGKVLLVAVSGGLDSTALLLVLSCLRPRLGCRLLAAHLDHDLRPSSSYDAEFVAGLCASLGIPCRTTKKDVAGHAKAHALGLEEAGRELRYAYLEETRHQLQADILVVAHQLNDLAEDLLMRLLRGAGWPGLAGMKAWDPDRRLLRPLLLTPRASLEELLRSQNMAWREDPTNADTAYLRNRIRHQLLPLFLRENPQFLKNAAGLWRLGRLDMDLYHVLSFPILTPFSEGAPDGHPPTVFLSSQQLKCLHPALRLRTYKQALEALGQGQPLLDGLRKLDQAFLEHRRERVFQFPGGKTARVLADGILLSGP